MEAPASPARQRLVVHLVQRLDSGALDSGLVNLIRHMPPGRYRHAIVCLKDHAGQGALFRHRDVEVITLAKRDGKDFAHYLRLFRTLRALHPDLIHTRNLCGIEAQLVAALAGVKLRVHGEHARDADEPPATRLRYRLLRRLLRPLIGHFIAASPELARWLVDSVGAAPARVSRIANGVDSIQFHPRLGPKAAIGPPGFMHDRCFVIGAAGPMDERANHPTLVQAFLRMLDADAGLGQRLRLVIPGDGPTHAACLDLLRRAGVAHLAWLPGWRPDHPQLLRSMDVFVEPSEREGRCAAILEAMASGLPVVASSAGINAELVGTGFTGILLPSMSVPMLAFAIGDYSRLPGLAQRQGARARAQVIAHHSLPAMAQGYLAVYDALTGQQPGAGATLSRT